MVSIKFSEDFPIRVSIFIAPYIKYLTGLAVLVLLSACQNISLPKIGGKKDAEQKEQATEELAEKDEEIDEKGMDAGEAASIKALPNPYLAQEIDVPAQAQLDFAAALDEMEAEKWQNAERRLKALVQTYPNLSGPHVNLGLVYIKQGQEKQAENSFKKALSINELNFDAYSQLGVLLREQGRFTEAESYYLKALQHWPHHQDSLRNLGILYDLYMGKPSQALPHYKTYQALQKEPDRMLKGWIVELERRIESDNQE